MNKYNILKEALKNIDLSNRKSVTKEDILIVLNKKSFNLYKDLNISKQTSTNISKQIAPNKKSYMHLDTYLIFKQGYLYCCICEEYKKIENFSKNKTRSTGYNNSCKNCWKEYQTKNINKWRFYNSSYRKSIKLRIPKWGQDGIKEFYNNCPKELQVDHIIPLHGKYVSGLHVINNLQYLTPKENNIKHNKFTPQ